MNLKSLRDEHKMTQKELADAIGKDRSLISKIEKGEPTSVATAKAIARVFGIDWTLFFGNKGE